MPPELAAIVAELDKARAEVAAYANEVQDSTDGQELPATLYHFTDVNGLRGIVGDRTLHASLATTMNDTMEMRYVADRVDKGLSSGEFTLAALPHLDVLQFLRGLRQVDGLSQEQKHYVTSFCGGKDHALHWLHYGRAGTGVALGFDAQALLTLQQVTLRRVSYKRERLDEALRGMFQKCDMFYARCLELLPDKTYSAEICCAALAAFVGMLGSKFKHPSFETENEWRLILPEGNAVSEQDPEDEPEPSRYSTSFKTTASGRLVPFKTIEFTNELHFKGRFPLTSIVLGASCAVKRDDPALRVLLEGDRETFGGVDITESDVPVRP